MAVSPVARAAEPGRVDLDRDVPALLLKVGRYPLHHGGLGVVRSLGRAGAAVHAVTEGPRTPVAVSRHLTGRRSWPTTGTEDPGLPRRLASKRGLFEVCRAHGIPTRRGRRVGTATPRLRRRGWRA